MLSSPQKQAAKKEFNAEVRQLVKSPPQTELIMTEAFEMDRLPESQGRVNNML